MPDWSDDNEWGDLKLVKCCGEMRPRDKKVSLRIGPAEDEEGFLTVRDYVNAVHPWLMGMLPKLREAVSEQPGNVVGEEVPLSVNCSGLVSLMIDTELNMNPVQDLEEGKVPVESEAFAIIAELEESLRREYGAENVTITQPY